MANWSLKSKLFAAFFGVALTLGVLGGISYTTLNSVSTKFEFLITNSMPNLTNLNVMKTSAWRIRAVLNRIAYMNEKAKVEKGIEEIQRTVQEYSAAEKAYLSTPFMDGEEALFNAQDAQWHELGKLRETLLPKAAEYTPASMDEFRKQMYSYLDVSNEHFANLDKVVQFQMDDGGKKAKSALDERDRGLVMMSLTVVAGFVFALLLGFIFASSLSKTFSALAQRLGAGADEVASAATQISSTSSELSASATQQASALQETVSSIDEVSAMVNKNAENAKQSQDVAGESHETATKGKRAVEDMIASIDEISQSNTEIMQQIELSNQQISEIVHVIAEIGNKTKVINDIVFQTKLLSFNASVEAARAGEHGKGFAVVAEEVGNLAQMSGNAAKEISQMLESSSQKVQSIVDETKTKVERLVVAGREKVESGTQTARHCGEVLEEIVKNVEQVNSLIGEISVASQEQAQGVIEINKAMTQLDQVTQQNATASQQSANASEQLSSQAIELREVVQTLLKTVNGGSGASTVAAHHARVEKTVAKTLPFQAKSKNKAKAKAEAKPMAQEQHAQASLKKAAGGEFVPSENDPRFEDV